jgi:hypothetical protein
MNIKITKMEEVALLHKVAIGIAKYLKQEIKFQYDEDQNFCTNLENELKVNIKNLLPEKIYNSILLSATMQSNPLCEKIVASTGYEVCEKLAHSLFYLQGEGMKDPISRNIQYENVDYEYDYDQEISYYLGLEYDQKNIVIQALIQNGTISANSI